eukprot:1147143-Pelagomonas_calceolata.AAC.2
MGKERKVYGIKRPCASRKGPLTGGLSARPLDARTLLLHAPCAPTTTTLEAPKSDVAMDGRVVKKCSGSDPVELDRLYPHLRST